jgi:hypothetical protein
MDTNSPAPVSDQPFPIMFVVLPAFVAGLIWLCTLLSKVGP